MRVYDLSKQLNIPSRDLLDALRKQGIETKSHMSVLSDEALAFLQKKFSPSPVQQTPATPTPKVAKEIMQEPYKPKPAIPAQQSVRTPVATQQPKKTFESKPPFRHESRHEAPVEIVKPTEVTVRAMSVSDLAPQVGQTVNDLILQLLKWGIVAPKNFVVREDVVERVAHHYGIKPVKQGSAAQVEESKEQRTALTGTGELINRLPVIVVVGHVDHGKTTLLDFIRKTRVAQKEKGGITQHVGAYEVTTSQGNLVFLDTPGHEAFSKMRQRGIRIADIAILVIAADDGIMPQTVEVIKKLKSFEIPFVVAINKVDRVDKSRIDVVKRQLSEHDLIPEEWGGPIVCMPISASTGKGVDELVEMVALQSQMLELKTMSTGPARCFVLEAKMEKGRGTVATLLCQQGTLRIGDYFVCGNTNGRVSSIKDSFGKTILEVGASKPVLVAGFNELPAAGDVFQVVAKGEIRAAQQADTTVERPILRGNADSISLVIKTDTNSSKEALLDAIDRISSKANKGFSIVHAAIGNVNESDVDLAANTKAELIGLHIKQEASVKLAAQQKGIVIRHFDVIYKLLEFLEQRAERDKVVEKVRTKIGEAIVRKVFDIKGVGVIAGSYVQDGRFSREGHIVIWRGRQRLGEGKITSLQRDKKSVKEVHVGYECGFVVEGFTDWHEDDRAECFIDLPKQ